MRDAIVQNGDALGRIVMRYDYDMLGNRIHQASMEAGERWMLNDVTGKPIRAWDSRGHSSGALTYDRTAPANGFLRDGGTASSVVGRNVYGESQGAEATTYRTRSCRSSMQAGVVTVRRLRLQG